MSAAAAANTVRQAEVWHLHLHLLMSLLMAASISPCWSASSLVMAFHLSAAALGSTRVVLHLRMIPAISSQLLEMRHSPSPTLSVLLTPLSGILGTTAILLNVGPCGLQVEFPTGRQASWHHSFSRHCITSVKAASMEPLDSLCNCAMSAFAADKAGTATTAGG